MSLRVVFMGTPEFAVPALERLSACSDVIAVYCQPDRPAGRGLKLTPPPVKVKALELGLRVFQPEKLSIPEEIEKLKDLAPDLIVVAAYGKILKQAVLDIPKLGCINLHPSLLPRWRGAAPIQWPILTGDEETGSTIMKMVLELDAGDILIQEVTPIGPDETASELHDRLSGISARLMVKAIQAIESGTSVSVPQDPSRVTYAEKLTKEMEALDPHLRAVELYRKIRGLSPWPGTSVWVENGQKAERLKIRKARLRADIHQPAGQIGEGNGMILLGTAQGSIELLELQWEGKPPMNAAQFKSGLLGAHRQFPLRVIKK